MDHKEPVKVLEGEHIAMSRGTEYETNWTVEPSCGASGGRWLCATHDEVFATQLAKDSHISHNDGCKLGWACIEHGVEVP